MTDVEIKLDRSFVCDVPEECLKHLQFSQKYMEERLKKDREDTAKVLDKYLLEALPDVVEKGGA